MTSPASDPMSPPADDNNPARSCTYEDCTTRELVGDSFRDLARVVVEAFLGAFDLVGRGAVAVIDYAEREVCGPARDKYNAHAELLANAERLNTLLEEEEKRKKNKFNPFNRKAASTRSLPAATTGARQTCDTGLVCIESDDVKRTSSFFGNLFRKDKRMTEDASPVETEASTTDDDVDITDSKTNLQTKQPRNLTPSLLKKFLSPRDKPSQLKVKVLMTPREEEPAPGGGGDSHNGPLKIFVPESAIVVGDVAEDGDAAREAAEGGDAAPESTPSSFSEDLFVVDRQQLDSIEVDFKDSKVTTS